MCSVELKNETVPLLRGGGLVTGFLGSFGHGLRETRLTAALGYVISVWPDALSKLFAVKAIVHSVTLEHYHEKDRSDILVNTNIGQVVIEAKVSAANPVGQTSKYDASIYVILSRYMPSKSERRKSKFRYVTWQDIADRISDCLSDIPQPGQFVCRDIVKYLEEHYMSRKEEPVEIYAREINEETSFRLFLHGRIYFCNYKANSKLPEALYFAPHLGRYIAKTLPGIHLGISYIAKIEDIEITATWDDIKQAIIRHRGQAWFKKNRYLLDQVKWTKKREKRSMLFLDEPQLVFNPPVRKENLQKGHGWLSRHYLSFNQLFKGWKEKLEE